MWPNRHLVAEEDDGTLFDIFSTQPTLRRVTTCSTKVRPS
jgi:hypothetical protein